MEDPVQTDSDHLSLTTGVGTRFMYRGPYTEPFGETEIDKDCLLIIREFHHENLSLKRDIIEWIIQSIPIGFGIFITPKEIWQKRM